MELVVVGESTSLVIGLSLLSKTVVPQKRQSFS